MNGNGVSATCPECGATALRGFQMVHDSRCSHEPKATRPLAAVAAPNPEGIHV